MTEHLLLSCLWAVAAAATAWYVSGVVRQITYVTLADGRRQQRQLPILFRLLLPLTPNVNGLWRRATFNRTRETLGRRITSAGYEGLISPEELLSLRLLEPLVLGPLWILFIRLAASAGQVALLLRLQPALFVIGLLWLAVHPAFWLSRSIGQRHRAIQRALPFVLDLLTLSVEAGMDFMSALQRNIDRREIDPLSEELIRVVRATGQDPPRRAARHVPARQPVGLALGGQRTGPGRRARRQYRIHPENPVGSDAAAPL